MQTTQQPLMIMKTIILWLLTMGLIWICGLMGQELSIKLVAVLGPHHLTILFFLVEVEAEISLEIKMMM